VTRLSLLGTLAPELNIAGLEIVNEDFGGAFPPRSAHRVMTKS
jgi:hypothetical protein